MFPYMGCVGQKKEELILCKKMFTIGMCAKKEELILCKIKNVPTIGACHPKNQNLYFVKLKCSHHWDVRQKSAPRTPSTWDVKLKFPTIGMCSRKRRRTYTL
ncbi:hypothetical protein CEXT_590041 [Caerostris extrusa]|uniref:Uncharacterized protein n=1 Tax=Caerostris extrusa TaxID=172846 RepID=A0AAV4UX09_CAEEX|nr:hypothetical protein CEXT_590041 [Caerostris extrusa]